jgi:DNA repair exonuclease SbcCD ATPase subunit
MNCKFLTNAYDGSKQINTLVAELNGLSNQLEAGKAELQKEENWFNEQKKTLENNYSSMQSSYKKSLGSIDSHISAAEAELIKLKSSNWKKMLDEANEADSNNKVLQEKISSIKQMISEAVENYNKELTRLKNEVAELNAKLDKAIEQKLQRDNEELKKKNEELEQCNDRLKAGRESLEEINRRLASVDQQIETLKENNSKIEKLQDSKIKVEREIREWSFLCKAFDKTGIPVLKLENSGIQITSVANELLSIFENKFRIVFETTKLKADKKSFKESFDINIVEDDGVCEISNKSGGQQVWLETAIQLAISLVVRNQGRNIQTAFLDEKDGALDLENAYHYIEMLRRAHTMSGVHNTFIITHRPELLDFIPQQIKLRDGVLEMMN